MRTHYQILGIPDLSSMVDVKKAYKSMALKYHPDRGGEIRKMQEINAAYEYLVKHKEVYDAQFKPSRPVFVRTGFTIVVNGYGFQASNVASWAASTTGGF